MNETVDDTVHVKDVEPFGEITIGSGSNWTKIVTALCILDNPNVNDFFLANKLKINDRHTKTTIFPRNGMSLPNGKTYQAEEKEEETTEN